MKKDGTTTSEAASAEQDLFIMKSGNTETAATAITLTKDTLTKTGGKWYLINTPETSDNKTTYIFGYSETLAKDAKTATLFDYVQLINMDDTSYTTVAGTDYASKKSINVYAYGIQSAGLDNIDGVTISDGISVTELGKIWAAYGTTTSREANTSGSKNIKGDAAPTTSAGN